MTEGLILALLISLGLLILGWKLRRIQIIFISSLGWLICAMQIYDQTSEVLPMILLIMVAISQFFVVKKQDVN